jgi:hypothetical protein
MLDGDAVSAEGVRGVAAGSLRDMLRISRHDPANITTVELLPARRTPRVLLPENQRDRSCLDGRN